MSVPNLLGPVDISQGLMLTTIISGIPYVLNGTGTGYYWESDPNVLLSGSTLGIFQASGTPANAVLSDTVNGGYLAINNNIITNSSVMSTLVFKQQQYATWFPPTIFLSMAEYTITSVSGIAGTIFLPDSSSNSISTFTGTYINATNIIILPILWYFNCANGKYNYINRPLGSVINWFCNVDSNVLGTGGCTGVVNFAYTNLPDCNANYKYSYCDTTQTCGIDNCNGPCSSASYDCVLSNNQQYVCMNNENEWWTSPLFIFGIIGLLLVIMIVFGVLGYVIWRNKKKHKELSESPDTTTT